MTVVESTRFAFALEAVSGDFSGGAMPLEESTGRTRVRTYTLELWVCLWGCGWVYLHLGWQPEHAHALTFPSLLPEAISRGQGDGIGAWTEDTQTLGPTPFSRVGLGSDGKHFALVGILNYVVISK